MERNSKKNLNLLRQELASQGIAFLNDEPMSRHTTFRVGGPADVFARPTHCNSLIKCLELAKRHEVDAHVFGSGSNMLVRDCGIRGMVVNTTALKESVFHADGLVEADCGTSLTWLSLQAAKKGLAGLEFGAGIPGSIGGGVVMNAGCYGRDMSNVVTQVLAVGSSLDTHILVRESLEFGYRTTFTRKSGQTILRVWLQLTPGQDPSDVQAATRALVDKKRATQPMWERSAGSVFIPPPGDHASRLIDAAGLKGTRCGGAEVSTKHAGFIINRENATAEDILRLIEIVRESVLRQFGVRLELEIEIRGE